MTQTADVLIESHPAVTIHTVRCITAIYLHLDEQIRAFTLLTLSGLCGENAWCYKSWNRQGPSNTSPTTEQSLLAKQPS